MLNVALVGILAGSLALTPPDDTGDDKKTPNADKAPAESVATPGVFETAPAEALEDPQSITIDTYALGRPSDLSPIKFWAQYAYGTADDRYTIAGEVERIGVGGFGATGEVVSQRVAVGAQINVINLRNFAVGFGGQLGIAKNEYQADVVNTDNPFFDGLGAIAPEIRDALSINDLESDFGLQQAKVYGTIRGRALGIHAGYSFDLGSEQEFDAVDFAPAGIRSDVPNNLSNSDGRDAVFYGVDFDYPSERFRLFGAIDYFDLRSADDNEGTLDEDESEIDGGDFMNFAFGLGFRASIFELGAALQIQTRFDEPTLENVGTEEGIGSHIGTVVPYLNISPPNLPASLYVKGATPDEYFEFGAGIGGSNSVQPGLGITVGISVGFE